MLCVVAGVVVVGVDFTHFKLCYLLAVPGGVPKACVLNKNKNTKRSLTVPPILFVS
jgi:hypothetical protein